MKAILEFDLSADRDLYDIYVRAEQANNALLQFEEWLNKQMELHQYGEYVVLHKVREKFFEILEENDA